MDGMESRKQSGDRSYPELPEPLRPTANPLNQGLADIVALLNRRRALILTIAILVTLAALVIVLTITPRYTADAALIIDTRKTDVVDVQAVVSPMTADAPAIRSEIDVLRSRQLAGRVVDKLGLAGNPIFTKGLKFGTAGKRQNIVTRLVTSLPSSWQPVAFTIADRLNMLPIDEDTTVTEQLQDDRSILINRLLDRLSVTSDPRSNTIKVSYESESPTLAEEVANTVSELYLVDQLEAKYDATKRANEWLSKRVADLKDKVKVANDAVAAYRAAHGLTVKDAQGTTVATQQLAELNTALITAAAARAEKESQLKQFQDSLKAGGSAANAPQVIASPLIATLKGQESDVLRRRAELEKKYGPKHPAVIQINAELKEVRAKIVDEMNKIVGGLAQEVAAARLREAQIQANLAAVQKTTIKNNQASVRLRELEREAQATNTLYEQFLARYKETSSEATLQQADARIIAHAERPVIPSYPSKGLFLGIALIAGIGLGICIAVVLERLDKGFRSADDIQRYTGLTVLGLIPGLAKLSGRTEDHVVRKVASPFAESIRSLHTMVRYTDVDKPARSLLITSSVPEEGKSLLALSLARSAAMAGQHVLLVDCDLRKPSVADALGQGDQKRTLADYLAGQCPLESIIEVDKRTRLEFIVARPNNHPNPQNLFGSAQMAEFMRSVTRHYDLVVLDSPPVMAASDAQVLSRLVDATLFVVRWGTTPRPLAVNAIKKMYAVGVAPLGVVLTRVNVKKHARYGFGDAGEYYGKYRVYGT